jgi:hypothetical protein
LRLGGKRTILSEVLFDNNDFNVKSFFFDLLICKLPDMRKIFFILYFFPMNLFFLNGQDSAELAYDSLTRRLSIKVICLEKENNLLDRQLVTLKKQNKVIFDSMENQKYFLESQISALNGRLDSLVFQDGLQDELIQEVEASLWNKIEDQQKSWLTIFIILIVILTVFFTGFFYRDYLLEKRFNDELSEHRTKANSKIRKLKSEFLKRLKKSKAKRKK